MKSAARSRCGVLIGNTEPAHVPSHSYINSVSRISTEIIMIPHFILTLSAVRIARRLQIQYPG